jgi:glycosyltransferase involved in cell wall biosynthesis
MMEKMVEHFSPRMNAVILVPSFPYTRKSRVLSRSRRLHVQLLGEPDFNKSVLDFGPDIIYSDTSLHAASVKLASLVARKSLPLIIHLRGDWWREFYSWFASASWRKRLLGSQQYCYNWFSLLTAKKVTPICKWLDSVVKCNLPWKPTEVVYQGVDPSDFDTTGEKFEFERPAVAIIQNHTVYPKVAGLIEFKPVVESLRSVHFYATEGEVYDQRYVPLVKKAFSNCPNFHFVEGIGNSHAVRKMLNSVDCYVLATGLDCCPTTVLEASLMRRPVVASRVGGVPETVVENVTGWTIRNGATSEWVERIRQLVEDSSLCSNFGAAGRHWVTENFSWRKIAAQVEQLILEQLQ